MNPPRKKPVPTEIPRLLSERFPPHKGKRKMGEPSLTELAEVCGVERSAASQWRNGKTTPEEDKLVPISRYTGLPLGVLIRARNLDVGLSDVINAHREGDSPLTGEDENIMSVADALVRRLEQIAALLRGSAERQESGLERIDASLREVKEELKRLAATREDREAPDPPKPPTSLS
jgi:transcriptional regulator with XRE-family HTH domain